MQECQDVGYRRRFLKTHFLLNELVVKQSYYSNMALRTKLLLGAGSLPKTMLKMQRKCKISLPVLGVTSLFQLVSAGSPRLNTGAKRTVTEIGYRDSVRPQIAIKCCYQIR